MNLIERVILKVIKGRVNKWFDMERSLGKLEHVNKPTELSPEKSWPDPNKIPSGNEVPFSLRNMPIVGHHLRSCISEGMKAIKSIDKNPYNSVKNISSGDLKSFEEFANSQGIGTTSYCKLPSHLIFKDRAVLYNYAIVLTKEMDKDAILKAPSLDTFKMVMSTYDELGVITNTLTSKLRQMGIQAQASHPLGGLVLYPPLAVEAGMGWFGSHGLLITPEFGARQRLSAIFVNIENLPINSQNAHSWIEDFCKTCGKCIRTCPEQAILEHPIVHASGRKTQIERSKCLPAFVKNEGCSVCIKECVFTTNYYEDLKNNYLHTKEAVN